MLQRNWISQACLLAIVLGTVSQTSAVLINELMASNQGSVLDPQGQSADWIELYNPTAVSVDVAGMFLTDDLAYPTQWQIPTDNPAFTKLEPGGYSVIWADNDITDTGLHASFGLDAGGDQVFLVDTDGATVMDQVVFGKQKSDMVFGRFPDAHETWRPLYTPTPGAANVKVYEGFVADTRFSHDRGFYDAPFNLAISTETEDVLIIYTLDGSVPDTSNGQVVSVHVTSIKFQEFSFC